MVQSIQTRLFALFGYHPSNATPTINLSRSAAPQRLSRDDQDTLFDELCGPVTEIPSTGLNIVDLPSDVLYSITDYLETPTVYALSLTCRNFYVSGFPQTRTKISAQDQRELLETLERDPLGRGRYYCQKCNKLHQFDRSWAPRSENEKRSKAQGSVCGMRDGFMPTGNNFGLGYHHARLAMNRHLYGPAFGIPLENICVTHTESRQDIDINCSTAASIIQEELFLQRIYRFTVPEDQMEAFYECSGHRDFRLCEHLPFLRTPSVYHQAVPQLQRQASTSVGGLGLAPCTHGAGSCGICLLDYDITIEHMKHEKMFKIEIHAYHQVGGCRSPDDWRWARFTERSRTHLFAPNRPNRRGSTYYPGIVRQSWASHVYNKLDRPRVVA